MKKQKGPQALTKREHQIMTVLYRDGSSTIADIAGNISQAPSDTALRTLLRILVDKGVVSQSQAGRRNVYTPVLDRAEAAIPALRQVLDTFFGGSLSGAVAAHLANPSAAIDDDELARLRALTRAQDDEGS